MIPRAVSCACRWELPFSSGTHMYVCLLVVKLWYTLALDCHIPAARCAPSVTLDNFEYMNTVHPVASGRSA